MYKLQKENVIKIVDMEAKKNILMANGFKLVEPEIAAKPEKEKIKKANEVKTEGAAQEEK